MGLKFRRGTTAQQSGSLAFGEPYVNTTLGTLVVGGSTGDIVLSSAGTGSTGNFGAISGSGLDITGNANIAGNVTVGGQLTIGDNTSDSVNVVASLSSSLIPSVTNAFDLGSETKIWRDLYISTGSIKFIGAGNVVVSSLNATSLNSNTASIDLLNTFSGSVNTRLTEIGVVSGSLITSASAAKTTNDSQDVSVTNLNSFTSSINTTIKSKLDTDGVISGSSQVNLASVTGNSTTNVTEGTNLYFTDARVKTKLNAETVVSGSSQITYASISSIPEGIVSGSSQVTLSSTTGGTTSSNVQFNSLGIGMAASATAGRIDAANDVVAFSTSDIRLKENIKPIENALDKISKISGNTYDWKAELKDVHGYEGNDVGVIAQEIEVVLPQLVHDRDNGYKAVKYDKIVALLIEGIKEQQTQIHSLTLEIEKLKGQKGL